jgi:hypothetical protein
VGARTKTRRKKKTTRRRSTTEESRGKVIGPTASRKVPEAGGGTRDAALRGRRTEEVGA